MDLYEEEWDEEISHLALETREIRKYNKPSAIPLAEDLILLSNHLNVKVKPIMEKSEITQSDWQELCEVTLVQTALFSKRRAGEIYTIDNVL